jgi:hypothetical protein
MDVAVEGCCFGAEYCGRPREPRAGTVDVSECVEGLPAYGLPLCRFRNAFASSRGAAELFDDRVRTLAGTEQAVSWC